MTITDSEYDQRVQDPGKPIVKVFGLSTHGAVTGVQTLTGTEKFVANGILKQIKSHAPNLTTDVNYTITIKDQDGATVYTSGNIADNSQATPVVTRIAEDSAPLLCSGDNGWYQITVNWSTSQNIALNQFKILLFLTSH